MTTWRCGSADADDLEHDVVVRLLKKRIDAAQQPALVARIRQGCALDILRHESRPLRVPKPNRKHSRRSKRAPAVIPVVRDWASASSYPSESDPLQIAILEEQKHLLRRAVVALPLGQRRVIEMLFFEHKSTAEAGTLLGLKETSVRAVKRRALRSLKKRLATEN